MLEDRDGEGDVDSTQSAPNVGQADKNESAWCAVRTGHENVTFGFFLTRVL
jgi:hypothetical protein